MEQFARPISHLIDETTHFLKENATTLHSILHHTVKAEDVGTPAEYVVRGIAIDSRQVTSGDLFFAIRGEHFDGHRVVWDILARGIAVVIDADFYEENRDGVCGCVTAPVVVVTDTRHLLAYFSATFFRRPALKLNVVAITGTNGKTTTSHIIESLLTRTPRRGSMAGGTRIGLLGTIAHRWPGFSVPAINTTPESLTIQSYCAQMVEADVTDLVMEASSHALIGERLLGTFFDVAIFTNLTQDHLDFHKTMGAYQHAKEVLFRERVILSKRFGKSPVAIINNDDPAGTQFLAVAEESGARVFSYGIDSDADLRATDIRYSATRTQFTLQWSASLRDYLAATSQDAREASLLGAAAVEIPLIGKFNVYNALAAIVAALVSDRSIDSICDALATLPQVPGRLQRVDEHVFVDYAHAPDAVKSVLETLRPLLPQPTSTTEPPPRLRILLGAGGDRDTSKRPIMGEVAARYADDVIVTNDNPRREDPAAIAEAVAEGARRAAEESGAHIEVILDRRKAIERAVTMGTPSDIVVIAGKGHETYQEINGVRYPFSDVEEVSLIFNKPTTKEDLWLRNT